MIKWKTLFMGLVSLSSFTLCGAEFSLPYLQKAPQIDGRINDEEWQGALAFSGAPNGELRKQTFFMGYTSEGLYIAVRSEMPKRGDLATLGRNIVLDDSLEFWFAPPEKDREQGPLAFGKFQYIVTHNGKSFSRQHEPGYGLAARDWNCGTPFKMSKNKNYWETEFFFPAAVFGFKKLESADWKMFFGRNFAIPPLGQVRYTDAGNEFMRSDLFSTFHLADSSSAIQQLYPKGSRIPLLFKAFGDKPFHAEFSVNGKVIKTNLNPGTSMQLPASDEVNVSFEIRDDSGKIIMQRHFSTAKVTEDIWQNLESMAYFHHNFTNGWTKADFEECAELVNMISEGGQPQKVAGREDGKNAMRLQPGTRLFLKNLIPRMPGALLLWLKPSGKLSTRPSRYFGTINPPARYMFYQESLSMNSPFMHFGIHNLVPPLPDQYNLTARSNSLIPDEWNLVVVNLKPSGIEFFINGKNISNKSVDFTGNDKLGSFVLGGSTSSMTLDVAEMTFYKKPLSVAEIAAAMISKGAIDGSLDFYVGQNAVVINASIDGKKIKKMIVEITDSKRQKVFEQEFEVQQKIYTLRKKISLAKRLDNGIYLIRLKNAANKKVLLEKRFENKNFPWINNSIGKKQRLLPGFTPVKMNGSTISVVLRDYDLSAGGLPKQIVAEGKNILAAPVTLNTLSDGKSSELVPQKFIGGKNIETEANYTAVCQNDIIRADINGKMEQDGLLKLDINFTALGKKLPEQIWLDIPVDKETAQLFHACGEGIRANPAGFLPSGNGRIWGSRSIPQIKINNFIPYCWVGTDSGGIAYAADWDKGWKHSAERDAVELHRKTDGTVSIRLHLINDPVKIDPECTMTLILMASPVKPMPENFRNWCDGFPFKAERNTQCLYSGAYWGQYFSDQGRYPAFGDYTYIKKLFETLKTGQVDKNFRKYWLDRVSKASRAEVPRVYVQYPKYVANHFDAAHGKMKQLYGRKNPVIYCYTCNYFPVDALPEARFFKEEWRDMHVYGSFADYAIYYFDKMLEAGMTGIYNDNTYMVCNYDWTCGNTWEDENGVLHPSLGIWRQREYLLRQYNAMLDRGIKEPWITVHHTNSNVLPALSFATNTMGMEWKYGITDYQTRFSSDYIRAVCQGRQGGFYPTVLDGILYEGTSKQRSWCTRTMLAALLPHEIRPTAHRNSDSAVYEKIHNILTDFGIGAKDCRVYLFWQQDSPVKSSSKDLLATSYIRNNKILIVCGNYGDSGKITLTLKRPLKKAENKETKEKLSADGKTITFEIKKHDLAVIEGEFL